MTCPFVAYFFFDVGADSGDQEVVAVDGGSATAPEPLPSGEVEGASVSSLGYPIVATRNTTRINGSDPVEISYAAALAAFPTTGPGRSPARVRALRDHRGPRRSSCRSGST